MALVDYASSSEEEDEEKEVKDEKVKDEKPSDPVPTPPPPLAPQAAFTSPRPSSNDVATSSAFSTERLPDASLLLESPSLPSYSAVSLGGHSSIIAAARAENMSRKRESNGSALSNPQNKFPRRNVANPRDLHNAAGGMLVPPQLTGRSNVVTEDIGRLFVNRHANPPH